MAQLKVGAAQPVSGGKILGGHDHAGRHRWGGAQRGEDGQGCHGRGQGGQSATMPTGCPAQLGQLVGDAHTCSVCVGPVFVSVIHSWGFLHREGRTVDNLGGRRHLLPERAEGQGAGVVVLLVVLAGLESPFDELDESVLEDVLELAGVAALEEPLVRLSVA